MSDSVHPHRRQPIRLPRPWDSPGKNTGVGCHFLLQCMKVKSGSEVAQLCPTLSDPMDYSPPDSSVYGILQARILEQEAIPFSRGSSSLQADSLPSEPPGKPKEPLPNSQKSIAFHSPSIPGSTFSVYSSSLEEAMDPSTSRNKSPPLPS